MATIEELDELSVEVINSLNDEDDEPKESTSSPARAEKSEREEPVTKDDNVVALSSTQAIDNDSDDEDDDDFDETLVERLIGLTEMFPTFVQNGTSKLFYGSISTVKGLYSFGRAASWILFSTSAILFAPVIFEVERAQMEEMQKQQQRQILLGPGAAMSGGGPQPMGLAIPPPR